MSETEKKYSEREMVLAQRVAVRDAMRALSARSRMGGSGLVRALPEGWEGIDSFAAKLYPLPKITRLRIVIVHERQYRAIDGRIQYSYLPPCLSAGRWSNLSHMTFGSDLYQSALTSAHIVAWADLLANPTEEVEDAA